MILAGRWAYKKYKKNQALKLAEGEEATARHDELVIAAQIEAQETESPIACTVSSGGGHSADDDDVVSPSVYSRRASDEFYGGSTRVPNVPPPSYSALADGSDLGVFSKTAVECPAQAGERVQVPRTAYTQVPVPVQRPQSQISPLTPRFETRQPQVQQTEIPVHGKWVWIPDESLLRGGRDVQVVSSMSPDGSQSVITAGAVVSSITATTEFPAQQSVVAELPAVQLEAMEIDGTEIGRPRSRSRSRSFGSEDDGSLRGGGGGGGGEEGVANKEFVT